MGEVVGEGGGTGGDAGGRTLGIGIIFMVAVFPAFRRMMESTAFWLAIKQSSLDVRSSREDGVRLVFKALCPWFRIYRIQMH